jgi:hypothetical protein
MQGSADPIGSWQDSWSGVTDRIYTLSRDMTAEVWNDTVASILTGLDATIANLYNPGPAPANPANAFACTAWDHLAAAEGEALALTDAPQALRTEAVGILTKHLETIRFNLESLKMAPVPRWVASIVGGILEKDGELRLVSDMVNGMLLDPEGWADRCQYIHTMLVTARSKVLATKALMGLVQSVPAQQAPAPSAVAESPKDPAPADQGPDKAQPDLVDPLEGPLGWHTRVAYDSILSGIDFLGKATADTPPEGSIFGRIDAFREAQRDCSNAMDALRLAGKRTEGACLEPIWTEVGCAITLLATAPTHPKLFDRMNTAKGHLQAASAGLKPFVASREAPAKVDPDKVLDRAYKLAFAAWDSLIETNQLWTTLPQTTEARDRARLRARIDRDITKVWDKLDKLANLIAGVLDPDNLDRVQECRQHLEILAVNLRATAPEHTPEVHKHVAGYFEPATQALSNLRNRLDRSCPWGPKRKAK